MFSDFASVRSPDQLKLLILWVKSEVYFFSNLPSPKKMFDEGEWLLVLYFFFLILLILSARMGKNYF